MNPLKYSKSNYNKYPVVQLPDHYTKDCFSGWNVIVNEIDTKFRKNTGNKNILAIECYPGVFEQEIEDNFRSRFPDALILNSSLSMLSEEKLNGLLKEDITDDEIFGYITRRDIDCYFDNKKVDELRTQIQSAKNEIVIIYGTGAAYIQSKPDILIYADMARWEIQMRFRRNQLGNIGISNKDERASLKYKRAFFVDWRICDRFKKKLMPRWDYILDTNIEGEPKMATATAINAGLRQTVNQPFRVVPFFDPGPWGGQWMKEVCDLDRDEKNFAWCFDCVPEENSIIFGFGDVKFELPSINLVFAHPQELLGNPVHARFGDEFPIRFDFLDTMDGGNLSLQVHPQTEYIQEKFGMHYTQEESYYMLDAREDAVVYLGLKNGIDKDKMLEDLEDSQTSGKFNVEKYIGKYPVKKHDHILIPPGTIHCSGTNGMVLEISATPFIFTFKLWDWARLGLDGRPRPINIEHGKNVIRWDRDENWAKNEGINQIVRITEGDGWHEEKTGLHKCEFIETRRHWFSKTVHHKTNGSVNVLNLVEGREAIVESPTNTFKPFIVHYAETFIIPDAVKEYTIRPFGESEGKECATLKAYVRHNG